MFPLAPTLSFFFFNDTATTEIYTLSLHDALPIYSVQVTPGMVRVPSRKLTFAELLSEAFAGVRGEVIGVGTRTIDRKSTRLNSSHQIISYAVFCLKKKK